MIDGVPEKGKSKFLSRNPENLEEKAKHRSRKGEKMTI